MVQYIKDILESLQNDDLNEGDVYEALLKSATEEVDRLDPRDFSPTMRHPFVLYRAFLRTYSGRSRWLRDRDAIRSTCKGLMPILEAYDGRGSEGTRRSFDFVRDEDLRMIIARDYRELVVILIPSGAWKSAVVLAGSILEAVLVDVLTSKIEMLEHVKAQHRGKHPSKLTLEQLIQVAANLDVLPASRKDALDQCLRHFRNYIHPEREIRAGYPCTEAEAYLALGGLDSVLNHIVDSTSKT